eukprot:5206299-Pyramimonas_sp.AAC.1
MGMHPRRAKLFSFVCAMHVVGCKHNPRACKADLGINFILFIATQLLATAVLSSANAMRVGRWPRKSRPTLVP